MFTYCEMIIKKYMSHQHNHQTKLSKTIINATFVAPEEEAWRREIALSDVTWVSVGWGWRSQWNKSGVDETERSEFIRPLRAAARWLTQAEGAGVEKKKATSKQKAMMHLCKTVQNTSHFIGRWGIQEGTLPSFFFFFPQP